ADAAQKGLQRGSVILGINGRDIATKADLEAAVTEAKRAGRQAVLLRVRDRGGPALSIPVRLR
ncbi:MAG: protease, partial [Croceibacterium sp.]